MESFVLFNKLKIYFYPTQAFDFKIVRKGTNYPFFKHRRLKSEFILLMLTLFLVDKLKLISEPEFIFLKISYMDIR